MAEAVARFDIAVIGAGIAGASVASELSARHRVVLLERESQPGYHTTGRSAALFAAIYGPATVRALTRASASFFASPSPGFATSPLLAPRGLLMIARKDQLGALEAMFAEVSGRSDTRRLEGAELSALLPLLRRDYAEAALHEAGASDIDVHGLHHGFLRRFRANGGQIRTGAEVVSLERSGDQWLVTTPQVTIRAGVVVNAAGAWADVVACMAGAAPVGLVPKRRTALIVAAPPDRDPSGWPMAVDVDEHFYLKPEAGRLLISPADETPSAPCDAQPEEIDIAVCVDRIERAFDLSVRRIENKWAGLRSFVADKTPVAGFDPDARGFFWLAGQGGYGIQTAPALGRVAASLVLGNGVPADAADQGVTARAMDPGRFGGRETSLGSKNREPKQINGR